MGSATSLIVFPITQAWKFVTADYRVPNDTGQRRTAGVRHDLFQLSDANASSHRLPLRALVYLTIPAIV